MSEESERELVKAVIAEAWKILSNMADDVAKAESARFDLVEAFFAWRDEWVGRANAQDHYDARRHYSRKRDEAQRAWFAYDRAEQEASNARKDWQKLYEKRRLK